MTLRARVEVARGQFGLRADVTVEDGGAVAVVGPNGAGKTTLLRALAGLTPLSAGEVCIDGTVVDAPGEGIRMPPERRKLGFVFQEPRLFEHLDARDNVAFGLRARGERKAEARRRAVEWLDRVGVGAVARLRPAQLSGGQAQRVALARALVTEPSVLLLDEPLASVDVSARAELRHVMRQELARYPGARLIVTHDPMEAAALAEHILVLEDGTVTQEGRLAEVTARPRSTWVATMVGLNLLEGTATGTQVSTRSGAHIATATGLSGPVFVAFRPNAVTLHRQAPEGSARNVWRSEVVELHPAGDRARVRIDGPVPLVAEVTPSAVSELGLADLGVVWASLKATDVDVYPA